MVYSYIKLLDLINLLVTIHVTVIVLTAAKIIIINRSNHNNNKLCANSTGCFLHMLFFNSDNFILVSEKWPSRPICSVCFLAFSKHCSGPE